MHKLKGETDSELKGTFVYSMKNNFLSDIIIRENDGKERQATVEWSIEAEEGGCGLSNMTPVVSKIIIEGKEWKNQIGWEFAPQSEKGVSFKLICGEIENEDLTLYFAY